LDDLKKIVAQIAHVPKDALDKASVKQPKLKYAKNPQDHSNSAIVPLTV